jgi:sodium transport system permease protein
MNWRNVGLIFRREVIDQLRDRRTLFMIAVLPLLLYPALGIGMVQLTVLFSEQPRTVVILGAKALPEPPLIENGHFLPHWFRADAEADKLAVLTDDVDLTVTPAPTEEAAFARKSALLTDAAALRARIDERTALIQQWRAAEQADDDAAVAQCKLRDAELLSALQDQFGASGIQVLIVIPPTFADDLTKLKRDVVERPQGVEGFDYPRPIVLHNSADEKSLIAFGRVQDVLRSWEREILRQALKEVGLPSGLPTPVNPASIDLAEAKQLSANIWSKLFPALLVIMALTGAFYPAIDLGAGEKERGTMETLLICPATRSEIVLGKFFTVMAFSVSTALLNLSGLGFTGKYMVSLASGGPMSRMGDLSLPPLASLAWVAVFLIPLSALFSALCLAFAMFARSSKEGQYYLTPLLMVTLGLTMFCLSPAVEMQPFYSVLPVMGPALLLKGLLLANHQSSELYVYAIPVLVSSFGYSLIALWWAIDLFGSEDVLFREAERFDLRLWLKHLLRDKEPTPSFSEAGFGFVLIMLLQFAALKAMQSPLLNAAPEHRSVLMMQLLIIQQLVFIATPLMLMGVMLTSSVRETFQLRWPSAGHLLTAAALPFALHPLALEFAIRLQWFFPPLPPSVSEVVAAIANAELPWWLPFLSFAVAPAICEEIAFRGFLLSGFRHTGRLRLAIGLSALTFGLMHMIPQQVLNASLLGLVLGLIAVRSRSILPGMVFHFVFNGLEVCRSRYGAKMPSEGVWGWFFRTEEGLQYQPALLILAGLVATVFLWTLLRKPASSKSLLPQPLTTSQFALQQAAAARGPG